MGVCLLVLGGTEPKMEFNVERRETMLMIWDGWVDYRLIPSLIDPELSLDSR